MKQQLSKINNIAARRAYKYGAQWARRYWTTSPFGEHPRADKKTYEDLWNDLKQKSYPEIDQYEEKTGHKIDQKWLHDLALHTQIVIKDSPLNYQHGRVLYAALSAFIQNKKAEWDKSGAPDFTRRLTIIETGTARGFSSICMAKALATQNQPATILTFDLLPHDVKMYWNCIDDHNGQKTRRALLQPWQELVDAYIVFIEHDSRIALPRLATGRVDFAFLDGAHTYQDIMLEFSSIRDRQQKGDMIIFDDYSPDKFPGLVKGIDEICARYNYSKDFIQGDDQRGYVIAVKQS